MMMILAAVYAFDTTPFSNRIGEYRSTKNILEGPGNFWCNMVIEGAVKCAGPEASPALPVFLLIIRRSPVRRVLQRQPLRQPCEHFGLVHPPSAPS